MFFFPNNLFKINRSIFGKLNANDIPTDVKNWGVKSSSWLSSYDENIIKLPSLFSKDETFENGFFKFLFFFII